MSYDSFLDITPRELSLALEDHEAYMFSHDKQLLLLTRHIGTIIRNKGLKKMDQITDPKRFYRFWFEKPKALEVPTPEMWKKLDKRYTRPTH